MFWLFLLNTKLKNVKQQFISIKNFMKIISTMPTTSNDNSPRPYLIVLNKLRPRLAKISVEIILMIVLVAAIINGIMILKEVLDQHTDLQNSIQQVNKSLVQMGRMISFNMTDVNTQLQKFKDELKEAEQKLTEFSKLADAVKQLNETVEELIHHKYNSTDAISGVPQIVVVMFCSVLFLFYQKKHALCS